MARKEDSKPTESPSPRDARAYQVGARYRAPIRFCAALLITPPLLAVSGGPGRPSLTSEQIVLFLS